MPGEMRKFTWNNNFDVHASGVNRTEFALGKRQITIWNSEKGGCLLWGNQALYAYPGRLEMGCWILEKQKDDSLDFAFIQLKDRQIRYVAGHHNTQGVVINKESTIGIKVLKDLFDHFELLDERRAKRQGFS